MKRPSIAGQMHDDVVEALLVAARSGSTEALGQLFEMMRGGLLAAACHELPTDLKGKQGTADLVQETFMVAHRLFHRFDGRTALELMLWLKAILRNTSAHLRRSYRTARRAAFREVPMEAAVSCGVDLRAADSSPSSLVQREETATLLQAATERLSPRDREVLWMRHHDDLTFEEVGRKLAISTVAARKAWLRAVERLRDQLELR